MGIMDFLGPCFYCGGAVLGVAIMRFTILAWRDGLQEAFAALACTIAAAQRWCRLHISSIFTVSIDPLGASMRVLPLYGSKRRLGPHTGFTVQCETEYERRAVTWFYRWHREANPEDWEHFCALFGYKSPPKHVLCFRGSASRILVQIQKSTTDTNGMHFCLTDLTGGERPIRSGAFGIGDLTPSMIINVEKWRELSARAN